eukprot:8052969-Alexandrium_andersonii.AAC.1
MASHSAACEALNQLLPQPCSATRQQLGCPSAAVPRGRRSGQDQPRPWHMPRALSSSTFATRP